MKNNIVVGIGIAVVCVGATLSDGAGETPFHKISAPRAITSGPHDHFLANYFAINAGSRQVYVMDVTPAGLKITGGRT